MKSDIMNKFISGLIFGSGFAIAFVIIGSIGVTYILPTVISSKSTTLSMPISERPIFSTPTIESSEKFLGSSNTYSGDFLDHKSGILAKGPGKIIGKISVNGKPLEGLKLRLALNGKVYSQWTISDSQGKYTINVPYGRYKIDGFELDSSIANKVLPNKINHPHSSYSSGVFDVAEEKDGRGLTFKFTDPVIKNANKKKYTINENVVFAWKPFPGATQYSVQIHEKTDPYSWNSKPLFEWSDRAKVFDASIDIKEHDVQLKQDHYYTVQIDARDDQNRILSRTARSRSEYDFEIVK